MKTRYRIIMLSVVLGLGAWVIDAVTDYLAYAQGISFWKFFISELPTSVLRTRLIWSGLFILFGLLISTIMAKREQAEARAATLAKFPDENPYPVLRIAKEGTLLYTNKAGWPLLDIWGGKKGQLVPETLCQLITEVLHSNIGKEMEVECQNKIFSLIFTPIEGADYVNVYGRDITQRKQAQEALQKAHDQLEQRVKERTAELELVNTQLRMKIEEHQQAEEALRKSEQECRLLSSQLLSAEEKERKRIAQELHDGIGQSLSAIKFRIENSLQSLDEPADQGKVQPLVAVIPMVQEAIEEVRRICMDLRPSTLDDLGILATAGWFCRNFQTIYPGILIEQEINLKEREVPVPLKTIIYRVLQESFNNIAKHSRAKRIYLGLRKTSRSLELVITDDGQGFSLEEVFSREDSRRGMGLGSMRERVELSGGAFTVESARGTGTKVQAAWTIKEGEN